MSKFAGNKSSETIKEVYLKTLGKDYGEFLLGENTTRILHSDPKLLLFTLSRYKFVSKMFSGFKNVLEIGCQEGFGSTIVSKEVNFLHAIDFFIPYIESCERRISKTNIIFEKYDILDGPIANEFDGVFALDVLEHIEKSQEDLFMRNTLRSMKKDGCLILGMPSLESQIYASEASKIGHVNCKTGKEIVEFTKKYFRNVFLFSMNDEVLHTGFSPMAHYLFVLCCNKNEI